ncbi:MAG: LysR family transcriptional regulator [Ruminiclostridium sp.]|nr:LysR family transcriptional regulator [Ruminiclostridium sp.]
MNFLNLSYFLVVAEELNISKAAARLYITQQSLSAHIQKLEKSLNTELFKRHPTFSLTYSGTRLVEAARRILDLRQQVISEINDINEGRRSKLSIGVSHTRGCSVLPDALPEFMKEHPLVEVSVLEGNSREIEDALSKGAVDLIIGMSPIMLDFVDSIELVQEKLLLVVSRKYTQQIFGEDEENIREKFSKCVDASAYSDIPFVLLKKGNRVRTIIDEYFVKNNIQVDVVFESENIETVLALAMKGVGATVYPEMFLNHIHPNIKTDKNLEVDFFPFDEAVTHGTLVIGYSNDRYLTNAAKDFIEITKKIYKK